MNAVQEGLSSHHIIIVERLSARHLIPLHSRTAFLCMYVCMYVCMYAVCIYVQRRTLVRCGTGRYPIAHWLLRMRVSCQASRQQPSFVYLSVYEGQSQLLGTVELDSYVKRNSRFPLDGIGHSPLSFHHNSTNCKICINVFSNVYVLLWPIETTSWKFYYIFLH